MEAVYLLVPLAAVLALGTVAALFWAVRSGQFEDLVGPAHRILLDEDAPGLPARGDEDAPRLPARGDRATPVLGSPAVVEPPTASQVIEEDPS